MDESDWQRLIAQVKGGHCTPFIGAGANAGVHPSGSQIALELAISTRYPFSDVNNLPRVTQFATMKYGDSVFVKESVADSLRSSRLPDFDDPNEVHSFLAGFDFKVYLTTNYDDHMVEALKRVGKKPSVIVAPWNAAIEAPERVPWNPSAEEPLIYKLHGSLADPATMVLTEDDYLEFIMNLSVGRASEQPTMLPPSVLAALTTTPLLFIGYSLQDWSFRALFGALMKAVPSINRRRHLSVQLAPPSDGDHIGEVQKLLSRYWEDWRVTVFWGTSDEFINELRRRLEHSEKR